MKILEKDSKCSFLGKNQCNGHHQHAVKMYFNDNDKKSVILGNSWYRSTSCLCVSIDVSLMDRSLANCSMSLKGMICLFKKIVNCSALHFISDLVISKILSPQQNINSILLRRKMLSYATGIRTNTDHLT